MYDLSSYDKTLFLDVDIVLTNNGMFKQWLDELENVDFAIKNSGMQTFKDAPEGHQQWALLSKVQAAYNLPDDAIVWNVHSEFIWWVKNPENRVLFDAFRDNFTNLAVTPVEFGGCIPDELPLWIAMAQHKRKPHMTPYLPTYWPFDNKQRLRLRDLTEYAGISIGGAVINEVQKNNYDLLATIHGKRMNVRHVYKCENKKRWEKTRHTI
jgi:glycosyltransferase involved in cell wall biosynthesis